MSRTNVTRLAAFAGLAFGLTSVALGATFNTCVVNEPSLNDPAVGGSTIANNSDVELAGLNTRINFTYGATNAIGNFTRIDVQIFTITAGGATANVGTAVTIPQAALDGNNDGTFNDNPGNNTGSSTIDLANGANPAQLTTNINTAVGSIGTGTGNNQIVAAGIQIIAVGATNTDQTALPTGFDTTTGFLVANTAESPRIDNASAAITSAVLSTSGANTILSLVCNRPITSTDMTNAPGTTTNFNPSGPVVDNTATLTGISSANTTDIEVDSASNFAAAVALGGNVNPKVVGARQNVIQFTIPTANKAAKLAVGGFVHFKGAQATFPAARDFTGNALSATSSVQITALQDLAVTSASFVKTVPAAGGNVTGALKVVFNNPISNITGIQAGTINDAVQLVDKATGTNLSDFNNTNGAGFLNDFVVANPAIDPTNPNAILFDVSSPGGGDGIAANGRLASAANSTTISATAGQLQVRVRGDGAGAITEITDVFGGTFGNAGGVVATTTVTSNTDAGDGIAPTLSGVAFVDTNGDGAQDGVAMFFNEPIGDQTASTGAELTRVGGVATVPAYLIDPVTGKLPTAINTVASGTLTQNIIPITATSRTSIGGSVGAQLTNLTTNNAVLYSYNPLAVDWDNDTNTRSSTTVDANEPVPGTADAGAVLLFYNATTATATNAASTTATIAAGTVADAAGNRFTNGTTPATVSQATAADRAASAFFGACLFTGDNQPGNNNQLLTEQDGAVGDQVNNSNRLGLIFTEAMGNTPDGSFLQLGSSALPFAANQADFLFRDPTNANVLDFGLVNGNTQLTLGTLLKAGGTTTLIIGSSGASNGFTDGTGNQSSFSGKTISDCVAPYIAATLDVNQAAQTGARLVDANNDGFVDAIALKFTQPIDATSLQASDFTVNFGGVVGTPALDTADPSIVNLPITGAQIAMTNTLTLTYSGAAAGAKLIKAAASTATPPGNGVAVSAANATVQVRNLQSPIVDTQEIGQQVFTGKVTTDGTKGAPIGTKVYVAVACPTARTITATHNNVEFVVGRFGTRTNSASVAAWTNALLQLEANVYLINTPTNAQSYSNDKVIGAAGGAGANDVAQVELSSQVIRCNPNFANLSNITFSGAGQSAAERITNGRVEICWDVLRATGGTIQNLYTSGYAVGGQAIVSRGVVTSSDGSYAMHVSAPVASFNGRTRLDSTNRPLIFIIELPDGRRFAASSLLTSVNGGPVLFRAQQGVNQTNGSAVQGTTFNVNLANIGGGNATDQLIQTGWNTFGYSRVGGWAATAAATPRLPTGVTSSNVTVGGTLPSGNALNQFVFFTDGGAGTTGQWVSGDDGAFLSSLIVDTDCLQNFQFAMTDRGVLLGDGITGFTGGYAFGYFNPNGTALGVFQFGAPISGASIFGTGANAFPTNGPTKGWVLAAAPAAATSGALFLTANAGSDYAISFKNNGPTATTQIDVTSQSSTATGNANNLGAVAKGDSLFVHYRPQ